jgi:hypothetical protein
MGGAKMIPQESRPTVKVYALNAGPFAVNDIRLKKHYVQAA